MQNRTTNERFAGTKANGSTSNGSTMLSSVDDEGADIHSSLVIHKSNSSLHRKRGCIQNCGEMCCFKPKTQDAILEEYSIRMTRDTVIIRE